MLEAAQSFGIARFDDSIGRTVPLCLLVTRSPVRISPYAGVHSKVSALVYVAARAPDAGEDYSALAKKFPTPPASAGIVFDHDQGRLTEAAFLRDFLGDLPEAKAKVLYAVQSPSTKSC